MCVSCASHEPVHFRIAELEAMVRVRDATIAAKDNEIIGLKDKVRSVTRSEEQQSFDFDRFKLDHATLEANVGSNDDKQLTF